MASVVRLKVANESASVYVRWSPYKDTDWGLALADEDVTVELYKGPRGAKLASKLSSQRVLSDGAFGPWVLPRALASEVFDGVAGVTLRRVKVVHERKRLDADFVYVDVSIDVPLDRDRARATFTDPKRPWSSAVSAVEEVHVLGFPEDAPAMARVTEWPRVFVVSAPLLARMRALKVPFEVVNPPQGFMVGQPLFSFWAGNPEPFPACDDARAVAAFRRLLDGDGAARAEAIAHPGLAYATARLVDRGARADTRASALRHPISATLYARFVDRAPKEDTRAAAARWTPCAMYYAHYVDRGVTPVIRAALGRDLTESDIEDVEKQIAPMVERFREKPKTTPKAISKPAKTKTAKTKTAKTKTAKARR